MAETAPDKTKLIRSYAVAFCEVHSPEAKYNTHCDVCDQNYDILLDFYNEAIYNAAQDLRGNQNNCNGSCSDDLEQLVGDYD